jgi:hypothetical protein
MDAKLTAEIITALVSIAGSALIARLQIKAKFRELEQAQLKDVLRARLEAYPELWRVLQSQISNWRLEGKRADGAWARRLFEDLNTCHARYGVLFSQPVYASFCEVRAAAGKLVAAYDPHHPVPAAAVEELDMIWSGRGQPGLATQLKDDLGSYRSTLISARTD